MFKVFSFLFIALVSTAACAQDSLIERIQNSENALVQVKTLYVRTMPAEGRSVSYERSGAGVIIDPSGLIVTNTHIIINAPQIFVILKDGTKLEADVTFADAGHDFSFLKIKAPGPLAAVRWADSSQALLGQKIIAVGNSELNDQSLLAGQVTSLVRSLSTGANEMIGLDLSLFRGDSGGPIFDEQGRLLGIIMAKEKNKDRSSLAIASNKIREQYVQYKKSMP